MNIESPQPHRVMPRRPQHGVCPHGFQLAALRRLVIPVRGGTVLGDRARLGARTFRRIGGRFWRWVVWHGVRLLHVMLVSGTVIHASATSPQAGARIAVCRTGGACCQP
jgi:hypothetical protein